MNRQMLQHHIYLCSLAQDVNRYDNLIRLFQSGEVNINMILPSKYQIFIFGNV